MNDNTVKMIFESLETEPEVIALNLVDRDNIQIIIQEGMSNESSHQMRIQEQSFLDESIESFWTRHKSFLMSKPYSLKIFINETLVTEIQRIAGARFQKTIFGKHVGAGFLRELIFLYEG